MAKRHICVFLVLANFLLADALPTETIFLRLYKRNHTYKDKNITDAGQFASEINKSELTVVYIHGFTENVEAVTAQRIVNATLDYTKNNIVVVDYRQIAVMFYPITTGSVNTVGEAIAGVLNQWLDAGVDPKKIHIVGHSLGGEVAGGVGRHMRTKIGRITALDPAGPLFYILDPHLTVKDADFVDVIHTDMGFYGLALTIGHADFYPNFGRRVQPGCPAFAIPLTPPDFCSHTRSTEFYAESIKNPQGFLARKCESDKAYSSKQCNKGKLVPMGYATPTTASGKYYLTTNAASPFARGMDGASFQ